MATLKPSNNVLAAAVAGALVTGAEHILAAHNITIPSDVADSLSALVVVCVAHVYDMVTGDNAPKVENDAAKKPADLPPGSSLK